MLMLMNLCLYFPKKTLTTLTNLKATRSQAKNQKVWMMEKRNRRKRRRGGTKKTKRRKRGKKRSIGSLSLKMKLLIWSLNYKKT